LRSGIKLYINNFKKYIIKIDCKNYTFALVPSKFPQLVNMWTLAILFMYKLDFEYLILLYLFLFPCQKYKCGLLLIFSYPASISGAMQRDMNSYSFIPLKIISIVYEIFSSSINKFHYFLVRLTNKLIFFCML
jgi:hypothetical protein